MNDSEKFFHKRFEQQAPQLRYFKYIKPTTNASTTSSQTKLAAIIGKSKQAKRPQSNSGVKNQKLRGSLVNRM